MFNLNDRNIVIASVLAGVLVAVISRYAILWALSHIFFYFYLSDEELRLLVNNHWILIQWSTQHFANWAGEASRIVIDFSIR